MWRLYVDTILEFEGTKEELLLIAEKYKRYEDNCYVDVYDIFKNIYVYTC